MRVPYSWLKDYLEFSQSPEEVAELLQSVGVPVENIEYEGAQVSGVVTGRLDTVEAHPDAERLRVCKVDIGQSQLQIVTAATNARVGMVTAVSCHGAVLADGTKIKKGKLRGVVSEGMFCGAQEVGCDPEILPEDKRQGILDLPETTALGLPIGQVLPITEAVFVIESFANRADQLSIIGVARELAAKLAQPLRMPKLMEDDKAPANQEVNQDLVAIEDLQACPRFVARTVKDIKIAPSPKWMQRRLELAGMRPINNVVDITNYVMLETGQPLHAYDRSCVAGGIIVRRSLPDEVLTTLDGEKQQLTPGSIVIADKEKIIGLAGVMGGLNSEIADSTKELVLESAAFDNGDVRRTSLRLGLRTEASKRFEKGMDVARVMFGAQRAAYLFNELVGQVTPVLVVKGQDDPQPVQVTLRMARLPKVLGISLPGHQVATILRALGFVVNHEDGEELQVTVPSYRLDVTEEVDLIEEVARHYGYDNLPLTIPASSQKAVVTGDDADEEYFRDAAIDLGLSEILTPSLCSREMYDNYQIKEEANEVMNPLSEDQRLLRTHIFPFMSETILRNQRVRNNDLRFFEISRVYVKDGLKVREPKRLALGLSYPGVGFLNMKGLVERLLELLGVKATYRPLTLPWAHPGRCAEVVVGKEVVGWLGELHPALMHKFDFTMPVILAELNLDDLYKLKAAEVYKPISRYPLVERDLAFLLPSDTPVGNLSDRFSQIGGELVGEVKCFDVYQGAQVPEGFKSAAFRFELQAFDRTLTEEDINKVMKKMQKVAEREFSAKLRD